MAASLGSGGKNTRRQRRARFTDINVTPMVDVMLVLLIIFMVAAPMLTAGVQVDLPKAKASPLQGQDEPLVVSVQSSGKIFIQKTPVSVEQLGHKLQAIAGEKKDTRIFVRGDRSVDYGRIMRVVGEINSAGFGKVALITDTSQGSSSHKEK